MSITIKACNLSYTYSKETPFEKKALNNINLEISKGSFIGIIGHTGSGKSTLVQHFNGLIKPDVGEIYIDGNNIWQDKNNVYKYRFKVGLAFQYPENQLFEESVYKDISFGPRNMDLSDDEIKNRVYWAVNVVDFPNELLNKSPFELSGGQMRKAALAGIISMDPDILVLDEPTAGLDTKSKSLLLNNIKLYHEKKGNTIILISHNMDDIAEYCDNIIVMSNSKIYMNGSIKEVFSQVDKLIKANINIPTITQIFYLLRKQGYNIGQDIHTVDQAIKYFEDNIVC